MSLFLRIRCLRNLARAKNINTIARFASSTPSADPDVQDPFTSGYTPVFQFPYIRGASLINRCKFYQTISTAFALPSAVVLSTLNVIPAEMGINAVVIGLSLSAFFYILGSLSNKLIGIVYINEKEESVRFAYLDFWGRRRDLHMPLGEIIPLSETNPSWMDGLYLKVNRSSPVPQIYKINLKFGGVIDHYNFNKIFMVN